MTQALTPGLRVRAGTVVRKTRELPVPGRILCERGDIVTPDAVVARAELPGDLSILRIPEGLGIEPFEAVKGLKVGEGDVMAEGNLVCEHVGLFGLFRSRFRAPVGGTVEFVSERTGHVGVRLAAHAIELRGLRARHGGRHRPPQVRHHREPWCFHPGNLRRRRRTLRRHPDAGRRAQDGRRPRKDTRGRGRPSGW